MSTSPLHWITQLVRSRASVIAMALLITLRPSVFANRLRAAEDHSFPSAMRFFWTTVGVVIVIETVFSYSFDTAFSDVLHHSFPIVVVLLGGAVTFVLLKALRTPAIHFKGLITATLYVGGAAILVMTTIIFMLLTADFLVNAVDVDRSPCKHRTIMCLLSGGSGVDYGVPDRATGTLGRSLPLIMLVILATLVHYSRALALALSGTMSIPRWRTYLAAAISVGILSPLALVVLNSIYRWLYS